MEFELQSLRSLVLEKSQLCAQLKKEVSLDNNCFQYFLCSFLIKPLSSFECTLYLHIILFFAALNHNLQFLLVPQKGIIMRNWSTCVNVLPSMQLAMIKKLEEVKSTIFELQGNEVLGSILTIVGQVDAGLNISTCLIQWFRLLPAGTTRELIRGNGSFVFWIRFFSTKKLLLFLSFELG